MKFLDGWKTILGVLGAILTVVLPALGKPGDLAPAILANLNDIVTHGVALVAGASALLTALGIIHKAEKAKAAAADTTQKGQ